jgi:surface protein
MGYIFASATALSNCNKGAMYFAWGAQFKAAYPHFASYACTVGSLCVTCITDANISPVVGTWMTNPAAASTENGGPIGDWNVVVVSNMASLFASNSTFTADLSKWNTASVSDMSQMFQAATAFNDDISKWNTARVTDMGGVFTRTNFNRNIGAWNVASVANMASMFDGATAFNQVIAGWNTARVANMFQMFYQASAFNADVIDWNVMEVRSFAGRAPSVRHSVFRSLRRRNASRLASLSASVGAFR